MGWERVSHLCTLRMEIGPDNRQDFWATTSNKQLNFVQHIRTMLKTTGRDEAEAVEGR